MQLRQSRRGEEEMKRGRARETERETERKILEQKVTKLSLFAYDITRLQNVRLICNDQFLFYMVSINKLILELKMHFTFILASKSMRYLSTYKTTCNKKSDILKVSVFST